MIVRQGDMRIERIDRIGLELGTESKSRLHVEENDPLSAVAELRRTQTMSRDAWQIHIETQMRLSCTRSAFLLQGSLHAWEGVNEVCHRDWDRSIPRDYLRHLSITSSARPSSEIGTLSEPQQGLLLGRL
jgi:hypothetical protein